MPTIRQYKDSTDRVQVVELWRNVFGYETAHNEPNLAISKKILPMKVKMFSFLNLTMHFLLLQSSPHPS